MRLYRFLGLFLVVSGLIVGWQSSAGLLEALRSSSWPSVPGHVVATGVAFNASRMSNTAPEVAYTYTVAGKPYRGSRVDIVSYASNTSYARDAAQAFPEGSDVPVYVDPQAPERSVLRRGANGMAWFIPGVSVGFVVFGIAVARLGSGTRASRS